jgi:hypothetical protein
MFVDVRTLPRLALVAGLLATPALLRAQDTLEAPAAVAAAEDADASGSRLSFKGTTVAAGQKVEGDVVAFGDVRVEGEVTGNVVVTRGDLTLTEGAVVRGDAVVTGGRLFNQGGRVFGEMRVNDGADAAAEAGGEVVVAHDVERTSSKHVVRVHRRGWMGSFGEGARGVLSTLSLGLVLAGIGAALVFFARQQLERVSAAVSGDTGRSAGVGLAVNFLWLPALIVGAIALMATIIGIPLIILYLPLFVVATLALAAYGIVAVAHALGEKLGERGGSFEPRHRNAYTYVFTGLVLLLTPKLVGHLLEMTVILNWLGELVGLLAFGVLWLAATVGAGAVIVTRGGTRSGRWPWQRPAYDPIFDSDPALDPERGAHV